MWHSNFTRLDFPYDRILCIIPDMAAYKIVYVRIFQKLSKLCQNLIVPCCL